MDEELFVRTLRPLADVLRARRGNYDTPVEKIIVANQIHVPTELLDAVHYSFIRFQGYNRDRVRGADFSGGFHGIGKGEMQRISLAYHKTYPGLTSGFDNQVVFPAFLVTWIRQREGWCSMEEAETLFHADPDDTPERREREMTVARAARDEVEARCIGEIRWELERRDRGEGGQVDPGDEDGDPVAAAVDDDDVVEYAAAMAEDDAWRVEQLVDNIYTAVSPGHQRRIREMCQYKFMCH